MSDRLSVVYRVRAASAAEARARAEGIAHEQTVEVPPDVVPEGFVRDEVVGRVEELGAAGEGSFLATISYHPGSAGADVAQLLNVVFGNSSMQAGLRVEAVEPGGALRALHPGARFGAEGVRRLAGRPSGGLIAPVLKPQGLGPEALARLAYLCAVGGADVVKEDHGLGDLPFAPFRARVEAVAAALDRAEAETGRRPLYVACLPGPWERTEDAIRFARDAGATGLLVMPGLQGYGLIARIARDEALSLPVMAHPAWTGGWSVRPDEGIAPGVLHGLLPRVAGADMAVFPNWGGRFGPPEADGRAVAAACRDPGGPGRPILPTPGGGMAVDRAPELRAAFGDDVLYLLGGSLLRAGDGIPAEIARMRAALDAPETPGLPSPEGRPK